MRHTDIVIVGGGLAGSTAAAMLGRAGIDAALIDPHPVYPFDFRCEKLDASQVALLQKTGLAEPVLAAATPDRAVWIARFAQLLEKRLNGQYDLFYDTLVNTIRAQIPPRVAFIHGKATAIETGADRQTVTLSDGERIGARLVILADGLNIGLRHSLGIGREVISPCHSISIGFDLRPQGCERFAFPALTYFPELNTDRMAYLTMFPIGEVMRANLFVYRDMQDPWLRAMRHTPEAALFALIPGLRKFTGEIAISDVKIRPVDLYVSTGYRQPGVVLVGDAFATSCPAAGTGCNKVFTDVERLCAHHVPQWLASPGMDDDKIAAFYDDPAKADCDAASEAKAVFLRSLSTESGLLWQLRRWSRFIGRLGIGTLRQTRAQLSRRAANY
jgi:2-polyprenyl-6-methoxyphenol hydroxylase-like FAD-dependent oxidoreductase